MGCCLQVSRVKRVFRAKETVRGEWGCCTLAARSSLISAKLVQNWRGGAMVESRKATRVKMKRLLCCRQQTDFVKSSLGDIYSFQDLYFESNNGRGV